MSRRTAEKPIDGSIVPSAVYTQPEACELLRLGRVSLLRLRQRGELGYLVQLSAVRYTGRHLLDLKIVSATGRSGWQVRPTSAPGFRLINQ